MQSQLACGLVVATLAVACTEATRSTDDSPLFDLVTVDGRALPAPWRLSVEPRMVIQGSIALSEWDDTVDDAQAEWRLTLRAPDGALEEVRTPRSYFRRGTVVGFDTCLPDQLCASILYPHSHAVLAGEFLRFPSESGHQALVYRQR
jgi:hypothetical protein